MFLFFLDYENRWVSVFEAKGKFISRFGMGKLLGTVPKKFLTFVLTNSILEEVHVFYYK